MIEGHFDVNESAVTADSWIWYYILLTVHRNVVRH